MIAVALALVAGSELVAHTFRFVPEREVSSVHVAGTFNNWNAGADRMVERDGVWEKTVRLSPGRHLYKFVLDGRDWVIDPRASQETEWNGNQNSILLILPADYLTEASPKDGVLALSALRHRQSPPDVNWWRGKLQLNLRIRPDDAVPTVVVGQRSHRGQQIAKDAFYETIQYSIDWDRKTDLRYHFQLQDGGKTFQFGPNGISSATSNRFRVNAATFDPFTVPSWVERSVLYQIFPDRFENGDATNDPDNVQPWNGRPTYTNRFGGDIAGVASKVDYLKDLGVGTVYFNPVFESPSNHRYDATDFRKIDPQFGTNEEWIRLTEQLDARGIRTVMDFVFNHTATNFAPFADLLANQAASRYRNWYFVKDFPIRVERNPNYEAWYGHASMPKLNLREKAVYDYLMESADYWIRESKIAGFRLDVAEQVPHWFWQDLRKKLKPERPNFWICGEIWTDGSDWLKGDQFDSVMNYPFRGACLRYFAEKRISATEFRSELMNLYAQYAPQVSRNLMNLLSSHDTPRFLTLAGGDRTRQKLAATVQFTWVGAPSVYYGEELGMEGGADPDNRRGMRWDLATPDNDLLQTYRKLAKIRNGSRALQSGDPVWLHADDESDTIAFARVLGRQTAIVAINRSETPRNLRLSLRNSNLGAASNQVYVDALNGTPIRPSSGTIDFNLKPQSAAILLPANGSSSTVRSSSASARPRNHPSVNSQEN